MTWVGVSGEIGAGKTAVARTLGSEHGFIYASFGDFVREEANRRGLGQEREVLQGLGAELIRSLGAAALARAVLVASHAHAADQVVVEGVRHVEVDDALRQLAATRGYVLVYLDTPEAVRAQRLAERGEPAQELPEFEQHSTERDVHRALRERAELVVSGEDVAAAVAEILDKLKT